MERKNNLIQLPFYLNGQIIGKKDSYVSIEVLTENELFLLAKEIAKRDSSFSEDRLIITVESKIAGSNIFVDISFDQYKKLSQLCFQIKLEKMEKEKEVE